VPIRSSAARAALDLIGAVNCKASTWWPHAASLEAISTLWTGCDQPIPTPNARIKELPYARYRLSLASRERLHR